jgi:Mg2+/Co2+ transporter CorB
MNYISTLLILIIALVASKLAGYTYQEEYTYQEALLLSCVYLLIGILITLLNIKDKMK